MAYPQLFEFEKSLGLFEEAAMELPGPEAWAKHYSHTCLVGSSEDLLRMARLCVSGKALLRQQAIGLLEKAADLPVLA
eukprot:405656-Alexandrium_andersonii.AAC.1